MTENELFKIVGDNIKEWAAQFTSDYGIPIDIRRSFSPNQQSVPESMVLYIFDMEAHRYAFQGSKAVVSGVDLKSLNTQSMLQPFQVKIIEASLTHFAPVDPARPKTFDACQMLAMWLNSEYCIAKFQALGIGVLKIKSVTNSKPKTNSDKYQPEPTFDFTLSFEQTFNTPVNRMDAIQGNIESVAELP